jgi:protein required for attachment to host cells
MSGLLIRRGEWVVVCDGSKALVLCNTGRGRSPDLRTVEVFKQNDPATREQGSDAPGRVMHSIGDVRSAVDQTDWHAQAERAFLTRLAQHLDAAVNAGKTNSVILVAPPRALGILRSSLGNALRAAVRAEVDKDLVKMPIPEIVKHLTGG